jgi:hypothetical protein
VEGGEIVAQGQVVAESESRHECHWGACYWSGGEYFLPPVIRNGRTWSCDGMLTGTTDCACGCGDEMTPPSPEFLTLYLARSRRPYRHFHLLFWFLDASVQAMHLNFVTTRYPRLSWMSARESIYYIMSIAILQSRDGQPTYLPTYLRSFHM